MNQPLTDEPWDNALAEVRIQMINRNEELQRKASNSKQEAEQLKEDYEKSKQKINNLKTENDDLNTKNGDLNTQLEDLKTQNVDLKTLNEDLKTLNEDLKTQNKDLKTNVENLTTKVEDLKAQNGEYQKQAEGSVRMVNQYETKFGFPHGIKIDGRTNQSCISEVQKKVFKLDGWNGDYPIFKATSKYGDEDVYMVHN